MTGWRAACFLVIIASASSCGPKPRCYRAYLDHFPRSVLVLPPVNESLHVQAPELFLSTVTRPLAEMGYYVLPVAVVDALLKAEGVPLPNLMHEIPLSKLHEVYGADAVLYVTIKHWTTKYVVLNTTTTVTLAYRLVDCKTGLGLWQHQEAYHYSPSSQQNNLISMAIVSAIHAANSASGRLERDVALLANCEAFAKPNQGLLIGPRHPRHEKLLADVQRRQQRLEEQSAKRTARKSG